MFQPQVFCFGSFMIIISALKRTHLPSFFFTPVDLLSPFLLFVRLSPQLFYTFYLSLTLSYFSLHAHLSSTTSNSPPSLLPFLHSFCLSSSFSCHFSLSHLFPPLNLSFSLPLPLLLFLKVLFTSPFSSHLLFFICSPLTFPPLFHTLIYPLLQFHRSSTSPFHLAPLTVRAFSSPHQVRKRWNEL